MRRERCARRFRIPDGEVGEQHGRHQRGAEGGADRTRKLHRGRRFAEPQLARAALCTLTCTTPITVPMNSPMHSSSPASAGVPSADAQKARTTKLRGDQRKPDDRKNRGQSGLVDQPAGHQRSGADADGERHQQEAGLRRRSPAHHLQIDRQERDQGDQRRAMAGGQGVAVPDRRLAQQPKRNERRRRPVLMPYQQHQRDERRRRAGRRPAA